MKIETSQLENHHPRAVCQIIVDMYCPELLKSSILSSESDQDCLIRPYLGRRHRLIRQSKFQAFTLQNFNLHANRIQGLALNGDLYAKIMAETFATLFWGTRGYEGCGVRPCSATVRSNNSSWITLCLILCYKVIDFGRTCYLDSRL